MYRPIRTLVNVKNFPPNGGGNLVGRRNVRVDDQGVVILLARRKVDFDEVRIRLRVLRHQSLDFLHGSVSFGLWRVNI